MHRRISLLSGVLAGLIGLIVHTPEARALPYEIRDHHRNGLAGMAGHIETAGILGDGETLDITSLHASGAFEELPYCVGNLCTIPFVLVMSIELDPLATSRLTLRQEGDRLLMKGSVHLLLSVLGTTLAATTLPATLEVEEFSPLFLDFSHCPGLDVNGTPCSPHPLPNSVSAGLLEFDGHLRFAPGATGHQTAFLGLGFSAVPEPSSGLLALVGATTLAWYQCKRPQQRLSATLRGS